MYVLCVFDYHDQCICLLSQVIEEALSRFRLDAEDKNKYQLVKLSLDSGRGGFPRLSAFSRLWQRWVY